MYSKLIVILLYFVLTSCQSNNEQTQEKLNKGIHKVIVEEVIKASKYTYLRVTENNEEKWLAITKTEIAEGSTLYYSSGLEMNNFKSKEIDRTFDSIFFVTQVSETPEFMSQKPVMGNRSANKTNAKEEISVSPAKNGITIAELFSSKEKYSNKKVVIRGQAVKYNSQIMGVNWIHIQDGTSDGNNYDLTITTKDVVKVGEVLTFEGTITLNKDFGAGYSYDVIMEEAKLVDM